MHVTIQLYSYIIATIMYITTSYVQLQPYHFVTQICIATYIHTYKYKHAYVKCVYVYNVKCFTFACTVILDIDFLEKYQDLP